MSTIENSTVIMGDISCQKKTWIPWISHELIHLYRHGMSEFSVKIIGPSLEPAPDTTKLGTPCKPKESNLRANDVPPGSWISSEVAGSRIFFMFPDAGSHFLPEKCDPKNQQKKRVV